MPVLNKKGIIELVQQNKLVITPILEESQFTQSSIDLRLGNFFMVSKPTREPFIDIKSHKIEKFFDKTYREFGKDFILYPNQLVLASTFEYVRLPNNLIGSLYTRSSINRLGVSISSVVQPGFAGTLTLELVNNGGSAINLTTGMRIVQLVLSEAIENEGGYVEGTYSKYKGNIDPNISTIYKDKDLDILDRLQ